MDKQTKDAFAADFKDKFKGASVAVFADYKGLSATQADNLRRVLRTEKVKVKVLKNNVARKAVEGNADFSDAAKQVIDSVIGPTMVAFGYGDPAAVAKIIHKFSQENEALKLKDSILGAKKLSPADIEALAKLPSREVLVAMLLGTMKAPVRDFVGVLAAVPRSLVQVLSAVERKKAGQGA